MMIGTSAYCGSRVMARVSCKPFWPGITTSIKIRSGFSSARRRKASSAFSAVRTCMPFFCSRSVRNINSVFESSTTSTFWMGITSLLVGNGQSSDQTAGQHDHRGIGKTGVAFDDGASLVTVELGHQDVAENQLRLIIVDFGQGIEAIVGQQHFVPPLLEKNLCTSADGVAVIHHEHFECFDQLPLLPLEKINHATAAAVAYQIRIISKSSLRAPHSGQVQL